MRIFTLSVLSFLAFALFPLFQLSAQSTGKNLFDSSEVHEVRITSGVPGFWGALVQNFEENELAATPTTVPYTPANIEIDGTELNGAGVRIKGKSSYLAMPNNKKSLKVDLNRFNVDLEYDGVAKFNLHNAAEDPSFLRDALAFEIFRRAGIAAPRTAFAQVYVNDEYYGLYVLTEQVGGGFANNNFSGDSGNLYKGEELKLFTGDENTEDWEDLIFVINNSSDANFPEVISALMNVEQYLNALAVETFFINSEGHLTGLENDNYYFYNDPKTDQFNFIPWDFNQAWGLAVSVGFTNLPDISIFPEQLTLSDRLLMVPDFREIYLNKVCELMDWAINQSEIELFITNAKALIEILVEEDPNNPHSIEEFNNDLGQGGDLDGLYRIGINNFFAQRLPQVSAQLAAEGFTCNVAPNEVTGLVINEFMASNDSLSGISDPDGGFSDWVELYNNGNSTISLSDVHLSNEPSFLRKWAFPDDVEIAANDYLIIWCDKDVQEDELHAVFNLTALGDDLILSHADGTILDAHAFGPQSTNSTEARTPNGTGDFEETDSPTFGENNDGMGINVLRASYAFSAIPNPSTDKIRINIENLKEDANWQLFDLHGRIIQDGIVHSSFDIRMNGLPKGMYQLRILIGSDILQQKILKL